MKTPSTLGGIVRRLISKHDFSQGSIDFLNDKGFKRDEYRTLCDFINRRDETFAEWAGKKDRFEKLVEGGAAINITDGRYRRYTEEFLHISSEQATVRERVRFGVEYVISLADLLGNHPDNDKKLVKKPFSKRDQQKLRSIYENFTTKDYAIIRLIERKTNHDIVAANTWLTIRAQQLELDENLMRGIVHYARTSADVDTNVSGYLYTKAIGVWAKSISKLISKLEEKAIAYKHVTCMARTHGQDAQLTTLGHIYANLADQITQQAAPLLGRKQLHIDGKIAGAIGTDVDMRGSYAHIHPKKMYKDLVEKQFGLNYVELGLDQDCSNASLNITLDTMVNVGNVVLKAAQDTWLYASRQVVAKLTQEGESGSSVMAQKTNPFLAEGCEALVEIMQGMVTPIKKLITAYREQGDLRRSVTKREGFHPIQLSVIAVERLISELDKYEPHIPGLEGEIYESGIKAASSLVSTYLKRKGVPDAYDQIKRVVMKPKVSSSAVLQLLHQLQEAKRITGEDSRYISRTLLGVVDRENHLKAFLESESPSNLEIFYEKLRGVNSDTRARKALLGDAVVNSSRMVSRIPKTQELLARYVASN